MKTKTAVKTAALTVLVATGVFAAERPADVPEPVYEAEPGFVELYYKAWELAKGRIHETKGLPAERYMDEGLWETDIWIWDTCFMSFFCKYAPKAYPGIESLDNFYSLLRQDGKFKPVMVKADNPFCGVKEGELTPLSVCIADNPPLFAWAELNYAKQTGDRSRLERVLKKEGRLQFCYDFIETVTPAWHGACVRAPVCAERTPDGYRWEGGRSGMDNTPRGRRGPSATKVRPADRDLLWLDLLAQQALAADSIAGAYEIFGDRNAVHAWRAKRDEKNALLNRLYWNERDGFYYDIFGSTREHCKVATVASYWTMMCGAATREQAARMCERLLPGGEFCAAGGVPSLSAKDADFDESGKYWRGSVWLPTDYMTIKALEKYGRYDLARDLALRTVRHQLDVYRAVEPHTIWECYAPNRVAPATNPDAKSRVAKDFCGWSALGPIALFIENVIGIREANAFAKTVRWELPKDVKGAIGVKRYRFGQTTCDLLFDGRTVRVTSDAPFTLYVNGRAFAVEKGENAFEGPFVPFGFVTVGPESAATNAILAIEKVRLDLRRVFELRQNGAVITVLPGVPDVVFDAVRHLDHGGNVRVVDARADDPVRARDEMVAKMLPNFGPGANPCLQPRWKCYGAVCDVRRQAVKEKGSLVVDAVMVGDSITAGWSLGKESMERHFKDWKVVSLACSGDRVQDQLGNCMWGGLDGYKAKIVQVMIGTNNALNDDPEDVAGGIRKLVGVIREKQPDARILLMPIFPSGNKSVPGAINGHRDETDRVNALIRPLADGDKVVWFELYDEWLDEKGNCRKDLFKDGLHPNAAGYELWATKMKPYWEKARADWKGDATTPAAIPLLEPKAREACFDFRPVTSNTWQLVVDPKIGDLTPTETVYVDMWIHRHPGSHVLVHPCGDERVDAFFAMQPPRWGSYVTWCPFPCGDPRAKPYVDALRRIEGRNPHEVACFRGPTSYYSTEWWTRGVDHRRMIEAGEVKDCDIVFWGDSITHGWERAGKDVQAKYFGDRKVFNIAVSGDVVAGCLWNAENGLLDGYRTKCVMLMIGTNNGSIPEIVPGVKRLLDLVREKQPQAVTFLLPIFPRGANYAKGEATAEKRGTNEMLKRLCDGDKVRFVDFNDRFLDAEGHLPKSLFPDFLHPNAEGYEIWAQAMKPHFDRVCLERLCR